jgi:hypothetical protein
MATSNITSDLVGSQVFLLLHRLPGATPTYLRLT